MARVKKYFNTYCRCVDLKTGCFLIALGCVLFGLFEMALAFAGIFMNRKADSASGVNITCAIWLALSIILILFSIMLHWAVEQRDMVLLHSWVHFASFFVLMSVLYVALLLILYFIGQSYLIRPLPLLIIDCIICTLWSGYLIYCVLVVLSYMVDVDEDKVRRRRGT